jgi:hypothetical protein
MAVPNPFLPLPVACGPLFFLAPGNNCNCRAGGEKASIHKNHIHTQLFEALQVGQQLPEKAPLAPALGAGVDGVPIAKIFREIPPYRDVCRNLTFILRFFLWNDGLDVLLCKRVPWYRS